MKRLTFILLLFAALTTQASNPKIGLVLGGGGAKGGAEVGVLRVLEEAGIRPDYIAGTSIGSIVGVLYAAGYTAGELEQMFCQQEWLSLLTDRRADLSGEPYKQEGSVTYIFGFPVIDTGSKAFGVLKGGRVEQVIDSMLARKGCVEFDCLPTPFRCVAASMMSAREVVLDEGPLPRAVRASMAIPGIFKPVEIDGQQLVDGGMMNNLPVDVVREMGADIVIAVDLQQDKPKNREQKETFFTGIAEVLGVGPIANWVLNRPDITKYNANRQQADIYINPSLPDHDASSFGNRDMQQMIRIGTSAARQHMTELRRLLPQQ